MRIALPLLSSLVALGVAGAASPVQAQSAPEPPVVITTGEGVVQAAPDRAYVTIAAEHRSGDPKAAQAQVAQAMNAVQEKLRAAGIPADAIRTIGIDLQQEADYVDGKRVPRGYMARNTIEVRVDDLSRLGGALDAAVATGATSLGGLRFDVKERAALERQALQEAVADARARAEAAARGAGQSVDRILRIEEDGARQSPPQPVMMARMAAEDARSTPVSAGQIEIRAQVTITAALR
ncbi:MAG: SIMPL domain-containing protein [Vicinamibacterales bacterium]